MTVTVHEHADARTPADLLRSSITAVWFFLVAATVASWALGTDHGFVDDHEINSVAILVIAFVKIRFIGLYFMEVRGAPRPLRLLLDAYCLGTCLLMIAYYVAA